MLSLLLPIRISSKDSLTLMYLGLLIIKEERESALYAKIVNLFNNDLCFKSFIAWMYFSTPTLLNQQEIKIFNIVEFLAIIFLKKAWWFLSYKVRETQILS